MARPSKYTKAIADKICLEIATTERGLHAICKPVKMPSVATVFNWLKDANKKEFLNNYTRAREAQADFLVDQMIEIADDGTNDYMTITKGDISYNVEDREVTSRSKIRVDVRKWKASKLAPKKYGDKVQVLGDSENPIVHTVTGMVIKK